MLYIWIPIVTEDRKFGMKQGRKLKILPYHKLINTGREPSTKNTRQQFQSCRAGEKENWFSLLTVGKELSKGAISYVNLTL